MASRSNQLEEIQMVKVASVFIGVAFLLTLGGCEVTGPKVKVGVPIAVKVEGAKHCPPGQAKKGNC